MAQRDEGERPVPLSPEELSEISRRLVLLRDLLAAGGHEMARSRRLLRTSRKLMKAMTVRIDKLRRIGRR